ncbi:hypothetical protein L596_013574 [Steinernema carpocapsae]|uniref:Uncharacterized protein n=1 Tax=Steinernema carpocapsae TaxID=34508 RepID=A0A4U5P0K2_STECR|nr:hypothetical protein L596_013574 [Steinernema carpocapsae]
MLEMRLFCLASERQAGAVWPVLFFETPCMYGDYCWSACISRMWWENALSVSTETLHSVLIIARCLRCDLRVEGCLKQPRVSHKGPLAVCRR